jgi:hypothetical protein
MRLFQDSGRSDAFLRGSQGVGVARMYSAPASIKNRPACSRLTGSLANDVGRDLLHVSAFGRADFLPAAQRQATRASG